MRAAAADAADAAATMVLVPVDASDEVVTDWGRCDKKVSIGATAEGRQARRQAGKQAGGQTDREGF
jgi:hypothetical protein